MTGRELMLLAERTAAEWKDDPNVIGIDRSEERRLAEALFGALRCIWLPQKMSNVNDILKAGSRPIPPEIEGVMTDVQVVNGRPGVFERIPEGNHGSAYRESAERRHLHRAAVSELALPCYLRNSRLCVLSRGRAVDGAVQCPRLGFGPRL